jgi:putative tryptophan/tyrosine transport system substrate-binding protein
LTVALGIDSVVAEARKGKIPVLSVMPDTVPHGALYASGPDYYTIGKQMGVLLTRVMRGEDIAKIPISYDMPKGQSINLQALKGLKQQWTIPPEVIAKAVTVIR